MIARTQCSKSPDRAQLGRRSRRKGKTWEREVAALLRPIFGAHIARGWQSRSGREDCDVKGSPFWLECKHMQLVDLRAALRQAVADTDGRPPVVIAKDDRKPPGWKVGEAGAAPMVVMRFADWLTLISGSVLTTEEHALLAKDSWLHDELVTIAFLARRLARGARFAFLARRLARGARFDPSLPGSTNSSATEAP